MPKSDANPDEKFWYTVFVLLYKSFYRTASWAFIGAAGYLLTQFLQL